jgi:hypothetical protein
MKLAVMFALVTCVVGAGTYFGATASGSDRPLRQEAQRDATPTAVQFGRALAETAGQVAGGQTIADVHCVKAAPGHYMCAYAVVKPSGDECHLMQGMWTPDAASTITVTLAGQSGKCDSVRDAVQSLG